MTLHDKYLQQALRNAPDQELVPDHATRHAVLTYARNTIKTRHGTWFGRLNDMLNFSNWQLAGVGSVFATLLVMVVFWHKQPNETIWGASAPTVLHESAVDAVSGEPFPGKKVVQATLEEKSLAKKPPNDLSRKNEAAKDILVLKAPNKKADNHALETAEAEHTVIASAEVTMPESSVGELRQESEVTVTHVGSVRRGSEEPSSVTPTVSDADKFAVASAPAVITASNANSVIASSKIEDSAEAREVDQSVHGQAKMASKSNAAVKAQTVTKNRVMPPVAAVNQADIAKYDDNGALAIAISHEGGKVLANKDINRGVLRQIFLEAYLSDVPPECGQKQTHAAPMADALTGYPIEVISACHATAPLVKEVDIYNQTMREWHGKGAR